MKSQSILRAFPPTYLLTVKSVYAKLVKTEN